MRSGTNQITRRCDILVLSRHVSERIFIGPDIAIMVVEIKGDRCRLGIAAPPEILVDREEIFLRKNGLLVPEHYLIRESARREREARYGPDYPRRPRPDPPPADPRGYIDRADDRHP